ncbi:MAG TPA: hypothetical protein VH186_27515 [Chloroflexia bacterium]|nr:hypothetical protein [Chloroflexia bacterium]
MSVEFEAGGKYRNRRGEYEVLEITPEGRLKVRYLQDGQTAELDKEQQARIIANMQVEEEVQARIVATAKPAKPSKPAPQPRPAASSRPVAEPRAERPSTPRPAPAPRPASAAPAPSRRPAATSSSRAEVMPPVELKPAVPIQIQFSRMEALRQLQFVGFGNPDGKFWFIGSLDFTPEDGNVILSERLANPEFQKEFTDAAVYKDRFKEESHSFWGSPTWQYANYIVTRMLLPEDEQTDQRRREYYTETFGAQDGEVLLTDISPLPVKSYNPVNWTYRKTTITDSPRYDVTFKDPQKFVEDELTGRPTRIKRLSELYEGLKLQKTAPQYVFCYGRSNWKYYKEIFPEVYPYTEVELRSHPDRDKTVKMAVGRDEDNGTLIILTPVFYPQEGVTFYYLDQVIAILQRMKR